jgi:hypothetical protein
MASVVSPVVSSVPLDDNFIISDDESGNNKLPDFQTLARDIQTVWTIALELTKWKTDAFGNFLVHLYE